MHFHHPDYFKHTIQKLRQWNIRINMLHAIVINKSSTSFNVANTIWIEIIFHIWASFYKSNFSKINEGIVLQWQQVKRQRR